ncbi:MAG: hypothetical protein LIP05_01865 [Tannerellaceae bacterium]|nr:hypothetical protein [Tannerellaceae bacterium]
MIVDGFADDVRTAMKKKEILPHGCQVKYRIAMRYFDFMIGGNRDAENL